MTGASWSVFINCKRRRRVLIKEWRGIWQPCCEQTDAIQNWAAFSFGTTFCTTEVIWAQLWGDQSERKISWSVLTPIIISGCPHCGTSDFITSYLAAALVIRWATGVICAIDAVSWFVEKFSGDVFNGHWDYRRIASTSIQCSGVRLFICSFVTASNESTAALLLHILKYNTHFCIL